MATTLNPATIYNSSGTGTLSNGNLTLTSTGGSQAQSTTVASGKKTFEITLTASFRYWVCAAVASSAHAGLDGFRIAYTNSAWLLQDEHSTTFFTGYASPAPATGLVLTIDLDTVGNTVNVRANGTTVISNADISAHVPSAWYAVAFATDASVSGYTFGTTAAFSGLVYAPLSGFTTWDTSTSVTLTATNLASAAASLGQPAFVRKINLNAINIATNAASLGQPAPTQVNVATTWDPAHAGSGIVLSNGNLTVAASGYNHLLVAATQGRSSGRRYFEIVTTGAIPTSGDDGFGFVPASALPSINATATYFIQQLGVTFFTQSSGVFKASDNNTPQTFDTITAPTGSVSVGIALDFTTGNARFYINGVQLLIGGVDTPFPFTGYGITYPVLLTDYLEGCAPLTANFGASAFRYAPPSGYTAWDGETGLVATSLATSVASLDQPTFVQTNKLGIVSAATSAASLGRPAFAQTNKLTANNLVVVADALGQPSFNQNDKLGKTDFISAAAYLGQPAFNQIDALFAVSLATGPAVEGDPTVGVVSNLSVESLATVAASLRTTTMQVTAHLAGVTLATHAVSFSSALFNQKDRLVDIGVASQHAALGVPALATVYALSSAGIASQPATIGIAKTQGSLVAADITTGAAFFAQPVFAQTNKLTAVTLSSAADVFTTPVYNQTDKLHGASLANGAASFDHPSFTRIVNLSAQPLATVAAGLGAPTFSQGDHLSAALLATSNDALGQAALQQTHKLVAVSLATGASALGKPSMYQSNALAGVSLASSADSLSQPTFTQSHALVAEPLSTNAAALGLSALTTSYAFVGEALAGHGAAFIAPSEEQTVLLHAVSIASLDAATTTADVHTRYGFVATTLAGRGALFGSATMAVTSHLQAQNFATASVALDQPVWVVIRVLAGLDLTSSAAFLESIPPAQKHVLGADSLASDAAVSTSPSFRPFKIGALEGIDLTTALAALGYPTVGTIHVLSACPLATRGMVADGYTRLGVFDTLWQKRRALIQSSAALSGYPQNVRGAQLDLSFVKKVEQSALAALRKLSPFE